MGTTQTDAIRPFYFRASDEELADLRRRINATKWPEREQVADASQGVQLSTVQKLARYWATEHDWRRAEAKLNALPQFITTIDGLDIHFIHVRSKHANALPMIVTHGWPGSIIEQLKIIEPLTNPTAHGGNAADAFHLVIPSLPGYGFSGKPTEPGWNPVRIARAWATGAPDGGIRMRADPRHKRVNPILYRREEAEACWREICAPLLFVAAADSDHARRYRDDASLDGMRELIQRFTLVTVANAGHMVHHEQPEAVAAAIEQFMDSLDQTAPALR